ncbi:Na+/H+ antiporter subunit E [Mycolicibacterium murale]|uniref:Na+/H+ antiporter subunit E n=1 Tax=Mycolicibacterium murale TaxID=182220 RepID=A0A7I9WVD5_9MYCO|nr:Na+/H+ antiporter subunit E [Mycolicibacterium murale]MCV7181768.1 Na+/H+ antiporter subunit E [Mycolicibacterium murale]GFG61651.1 Na+/H+ antiporter subunit E [Mycolicibacterium murale]
MRWFMLRIWVLVGLTAVWVLLWGNVSAANVLSGLAVGLLITVFLPLPRVPVQGKVHVLSLLNLVIRVNVYLVMSSFQIAWLAIRPGPPPLSAVLRAQLSVKSDLVLALAVNIYNLIPGSIVLEIDQVRRLLYAHVINVGSDKAVKQFYHQVAVVERLLIAAFERDSEWRPASAEELAGDPETEEAPQ